MPFPSVPPSGDAIPPATTGGCPSPPVYADLPAIDLIIRLSQLAREAGLRPPDSVPPPRPNTSPTFPVFDPTDRPAAPSPLRASAWRTLLRQYPEPSLPRNIIGMIEHGAKLGYSGPLRGLGRPAASVPNLPMDDTSLQHVRDTVADRVRTGWARRAHAGERVVVSPIGTVPKSGGKVRTINHLSWPRRPSSPSVNDGIDPALVSLEYSTLDKLFGSIRRRLPPGDIWKADLTDAFFHVTVASRDAHLLGFHLDGETYMDCTLNFGGRSSPFLFNLVAEALHWILESFGLDCSHYLDDSFGLVARGMGPATLRFFMAVCSALGIAVSTSKSTSGDSVEVLGILVCSSEARAWITQKRINNLRVDIDRILAQPRASPLDLQSIAGSLNFVSRVCPTGRAFMRRIYDGVRDLTNRWGSQTTSGALGEDLRWWRSTLATWDGVGIIPRDLPRIEVWTDAATTRGLGGHLGPREACTKTFSVQVDPRHTGKDIFFLETLALLTAFRTWAEDLKDHEVVCKVDNAALAACLRSGSCDHRATQTLLRHLFALAMELHVTLISDWVPSAVNDVADALSRFDWPYLRTRRPNVPLPLAQPSMTPIPKPNPATPLAGPPIHDRVTPLPFLPPDLLLP